MSDLFPEIDDGGDLNASPKAITIPVGKNPAGKSLLCGENGRRTYEALMRLPRPFSGCDSLRVTRVAVALENGSVHITVEGAKLGAHTLILYPCWPHSEGNLDFYVAYRGSIPNDTIRTLLQAVQEHMSRARYKTLLRAALRDPQRTLRSAMRSNDVYGDSNKGPDEMDDDGYQHSLVRTWAADSAWREFFADKEQERNFNHQLRGRIVMVEHGDLECHYSTQPIGDGTMGFFNYSTSHVRDRRQTDEEGEHISDGSAYLISDLTEQDIIRGGVGKMDALLDSIAARDNPPDLVVARGTCTTVVIGDDMRGAIARFTERTGVPAVFLAHLEDGDADQFQAVYEASRRHWKGVDPGQFKGRVNLVGYPNRGEDDDLRMLVEGLGLKINATLIPAIYLDQLQRFAKAETSVLFDSNMYNPSYRRILVDAPVPSIRPPAPYTPLGSRKWIEAIAATTHTQDQIEATWDAVWSPLDAEWKTLVSQVDGYRMGFVVDAARFDALLHPERGTGVPVIRALQEMGFALEFLCFGAEPSDFADAMAIIDADSTIPSILRCYANNDELEACLKDSQSVAFYSEFFFDKRLTRTGHAQFSVADFHLGPSGSIQSLRKLLRICRLPFYRVYANYLGDAFTPSERA